MEKIKKYSPIIIIILFVVLAFIFYSKGIVGGYSIKGNDGNYSSQHMIQQWVQHGSPLRWHAPLGMGTKVNTPLSLYVVFMKIFPLNIALSLSYFFAMIMTFIFTFLLFQRYKLDLIPSVFGAVAFAFSPHFISLIFGGHMTIVEMPAMISMLIYFIHLIFDAEINPWQNILSIIPAGVAWGVVMSQEPQRGLYVSVMVGTYMLFLIVQSLHTQIKDRKKYLNNRFFYLTIMKPVLIAIILFFTFFHSMKGWLSFAQLDSGSSSTAQTQMSPEQKWEFSTSWSYYPTEIFENLAWGYFGKESYNPESPYWGKFEYFASSEVLGFLVLIFMILGVALNTHVRKKKIFGKEFNLPVIEQPVVRIFFWLGLTAWFLSMGKYLPGRPLFWLYYHIPFMDKFRIAVKFFAVTAYSWVIVSAFGVQSFINLLEDSKQNDKKLNLIWKGSLFLTGLAIILFLITLIGKENTIDTFFYQFKNRDFAAAAVNNMITSLGRFILLSASLAGIITLLRLRDKFKLSAAVVSWALIPILILELWTVNKYYQEKSYFKPQDYYSGDALMNTLDHFDKTSRFSLTMLVPNQGQVIPIPITENNQYYDYRQFQFNYKDLELLEISQSSRPDQLFNEYLIRLLTAKVGPQGLQSLNDLIDMNTFVYRLTGTRFVITDGFLYNSQKPMVIFYSLLSNQSYTFKGNAKSKQGRDHFIFEVKDSLPRLAFFQSAEMLPLAQHLRTITSPDWDIKKSLVLESNTSNHLGLPQPQDLLEVQITDFKPWLIKGNVNAPSAGWVMHNARYDKDWKVYVDGKKEDLQRANYLVQAVTVPQGSHVIEFRFEPNLIWANLAQLLVWLGSLTAVFLLVWVNLISRKKDGEN